MIDSTTPTPVCTRLAAPDRHVPRRTVGPPLPRRTPRRPSSASHAHPDTPAVESII